MGNIIDFPEQLTPPQEACTHVDGYGSTIIFVQHRPTDGICMLCDKEFPEAFGRVVVKAEAPQGEV